MSFMDKFKKASRSLVDTGAKTMLKVRALRMARMQSVGGQRMPNALGCGAMPSLGACTNLLIMRRWTMFFRAF